MIEERKLSADVAPVLIKVPAPCPLIGKRETSRNVSKSTISDT